MHRTFLNSYKKHISTATSNCQDCKLATNGETPHIKTACAASLSQKTLYGSGFTEGCLLEPPYASIELGNVRVTDPYFVASTKAVQGTAGLIDGILGLARGSIPTALGYGQSSRTFFDLINLRHGHVLTFRIAPNINQKSYMEITESRPQDQGIQYLDVLPFDKDPTRKFYWQISIESASFNRSLIIEPNGEYGEHLDSRADTAKLRTHHYGTSA